jgi:hypothetical protein
MHVADVLWMLAELILGSSDHVQNGMAPKYFGTNLRFLYKMVCGTSCDDFHFSRKRPVHINIFSTGSRYSRCHTR